MAALERTLRAVAIRGYLERSPTESLPAGWKIFERRVEAWSVYLLLSPTGRVYHAPTPTLAEALPLGPAATEVWVNAALRDEERG